MEETWLTRDDLSARWGVPKQTLASWASQRRGPRYGKFGNHIRYALSDVVAFEQQHMVTTSGG